jgi:3-deoxy-7-phosphoheptulonate synthase
MSSGLMTPIGFKNGTSGDIGVAINAIEAASQPHSFLGINAQGQIAIVRTEGNKYGHLILRGAEDQPNYDVNFVTLAETVMGQAKLNTSIVVDCSHGNSFKKPELQPQVMLNVVDQICQGNKSLVGLMIESNIEAGKQKIPKDLKNLRYGCSVTDACIDWETTEKMILESADLLRKVLPKRSIDFSVSSV